MLSAPAAAGGTSAPPRAERGDHPGPLGDHPGPLPGKNLASQLWRVGQPPGGLALAATAPIAGSHPPDLLLAPSATLPRA